MLIFKSHAVSRAILIGVTYAATEAMVLSGPKLWQRAMSGSVDLFQLGSVIMFMKPQVSQKIMSAKIRGFC